MHACEKVALNDTWTRLRLDFLISWQDYCVLFKHWRIQDFPEGMPTPQRAPTYYVTNFFPKKLHENEEILAGACIPRAPKIRHW